MGNLDTNPVYAWQDEDNQVSALMQQIYLNFVKTGNPNGVGVPAWPRLSADSNAQYMWIDTVSHVANDVYRVRYEVLERVIVVPE
jgi:para-nitrobenzyl esterase